MNQSWERTDALVKAKAHLAGYLYVSDQDKKVVGDFYMSGQDRNQSKFHACQWCSKEFVGQEYLDNHVKDWHADQLRVARTSQAGSSSKSARQDKRIHEKLCWKFGISRTAEMCIPKLPTPSLPAEEENESEEEVDLVEAATDRQDSSSSATWNCVTCGVSFAAKRYYKDHCKRKRHLRNLTK